MSPNEIPKRVMEEEIQCPRKVGQPKLRWMDGVIQDAQELLGVRNCSRRQQPKTEPRHRVGLDPLQEPTTEILGGHDLYIDRGSTINLTCVVRFSPEAPAYIFWNHNDAIISYDSARGGVSVITEKGDTTTSFLLIQNANPKDSGRYQCNPSNAQAKSIMVHVLNGREIATGTRALEGANRAEQVPGSDATRRPGTPPQLPPVLLGIVRRVLDTHDVTALIEAET
nr:uncharacterized protein LOC106685505 [Halyomorpha halys]